MRKRISIVFICLSINILLRYYSVEPLLGLVTNSNGSLIGLLLNVISNKSGKSILIINVLLSIWVVVIYKGKSTKEEQEGYILDIYKLSIILTVLNIILHII